MARFGYGCEYCEGTVRDKRVEREAFKHSSGFVILKNVVIGVCDRCGNRYYSANSLKQVQSIANGERQADETEQIPVANAVV